jgi:hypothetical protein
MHGTSQCNRSPPNTDLTGSWGVVSLASLSA